MTRPAVLFAVLSVAGCSNAERVSVVSPEYDPASGRLTHLGYDSNRDGRPDMAATMDGQAVRVIEIDVDHDGLADRWEYYEPADRGGLAAEQDGPRLSRIEQVSRRDGTIVRREGYEAGELAWVREDRDADGRIDRWETYVAGALSMVELDTTGAGHPSRRIRYDGGQARVETLN